MLRHKLYEVCAAFAWPMKSLDQTAPELQQMSAHPPRQGLVLVLELDQLCWSPKPGQSSQCFCPAKLIRKPPRRFSRISSTQLQVVSLLPVTVQCSWSTNLVAQSSKYIQKPMMTAKVPRWRHKAHTSKGIGKHFNVMKAIISSLSWYPTRLTNTPQTKSSSHFAKF